MIGWWSIGGKKMWKEADMIQFKVIFCHLPGETYKNHKNSVRTVLPLLRSEPTLLSLRGQWQVTLVSTIGLSPLLFVSLPGIYVASYVDFPNRMQPGYMILSSCSWDWVHSHGTPLSWLKKFIIFSGALKKYPVSFYGRAMHGSSLTGDRLPNGTLLWYQLQCMHPLQPLDADPRSHSVSITEMRSGNGYELIPDTL
jgi:hypothetical protein